MLPAKRTSTPFSHPRAPLEGTLSPVGIGAEPVLIHRR
jgi:hypothetical protein